MSKIVETSNVKITNTKGENALEIAIKNYNLVLLKVILQKKLSSPNEIIKGKKTCLHVLCERIDSDLVENHSSLRNEMIKIFVENGADPNSTDENLNTPLFYLVQNEFSNTFLFFILYFLFFIFFIFYFYFYLFLFFILFCFHFLGLN